MNRNRYLTEKGAVRRWWEIPALLGDMLFAGVGVTTFIEEFRFSEGLSSLLAWLLVLMLVSCPLYFLGRRLLRRRCAQRIAKRLETKVTESIPLSSLDRVTGETGAAEKIRKLIGTGFMENLLVDEGNGCLWLASRAAEIQQMREPLADAGYNEILEKIRAINREIDSPAVSKHIERIEVVTRDIFRTLEANPDKASDARRFMNYYLPTLFKLLETYNLLEDQSYQGETIRTSRKQIEEILAKLVAGVERQQDKLFRADAMDVEAEIKVLETMMTADGLSEDGTLQALRR